VRAFDIAHVSTVLLVALIPSLALSGTDPAMALLCALAAAVGAAIACFVCRWWPGLSASWWRLWVGAWLFNPVVILALAYVASEYACLLGLERGWQCMGLGLVVLASPLTLIGPTVAVIANAISRRTTTASG
jgi:hypothetical protein